MVSQDTQPLSGLKVVDLTQVMLGPCATQVLADYGADVIKIERPGAGDLSRGSVPDDPDGADNPVFRSLNRNKRSIALNLGKDEGKAVLLDMLKTADVVVNNFRAGVMERMGLGYDVLSAANPRIIYAFGTGFGLTGPLAKKGGQDILAQAVSGLMARKSNATDPLTIYPTALCDYSAGMHLVQAILLALLQREKTGRGQSVAVSLLESALAMQMQEAAMMAQRDFDLSWGDRPLTGVFNTTDGAVVFVGAFRPHPLRDLCAALELDDLSADPRFDTFANQVTNKAELQKIFRDRVAANTTAYWLARLEQQDFLCAPVLSLKEALVHEQTKINGTVVEVQGKKSMRLIGTPITMAEGAFRVRSAPPELGAHGRAILQEMGYSAERIDKLAKAGILG